MNENQYIVALSNCDVEILDRFLFKYKNITKIVMFKSRTNENLSVYNQVYNLPYNIEKVWFDLSYKGNGNYNNHKNVVKKFGKIPYKVKTPWLELPRKLRPNQRIEEYIKEEVRSNNRVANLADFIEKKYVIK